MERNVVSSYSISGYGDMIADTVRMNAYVQALRQCVQPGSVLLDVGTGTGIFALLGCRFGARQVYAIEPDDAIHVARQLAAANGYADRIEFVQALSTQVTLPERADVIISDLRGVLPLYQHHLPSIADARQRLLAPTGVMIPKCDTLWVAVVDAPNLYARCTTPWNGNIYDLDMQAAKRLVANTWIKARVAPEQLLVEPHCWATLDYATLENPNVSGATLWRVARPGTAHGLTVWFDTILGHGVSFSNAPGAPELIYGRAFFPWPAPVTLDLDDSVSVTLRADLVGEDYVWRWDTCVLDRGRPGQVKARFKQSTFFGVPLSPAQLHKRSAEHVPDLTEDGRIDQFILTLMDGETSLAEITHRVSARFSHRFHRWQDALAKVGDLSITYSR